MPALGSTNEGSLAFMGESLDSFDTRNAHHRSQFSVGGISIAVRGQNVADVELGAQLEPFRAEGVSDIEIEVERVVYLDPGTGRKVFDSGSTWRLYEGNSSLQFDFLAAVLGDQPIKRLLVHRQFRRARLQLNQTCAAILGHAIEPLSYPVDELLIMHRLTQEKAIELHACGIVTGGIGNLFVGHSGAGKSTTTRLWSAREDVEVLSDDRIIVRAIETDSRALRGMRMYGTPWHGEAMYASPNSAPLARIFILEHGQGNTLTPLSTSRAVAELFARSFVPFHRHDYVESALDFLQRLVDAVPCYRYAFEPTEAAVDAVLNLQD
jgi:hypothetical protein